MRLWGQLSWSRFINITMYLKLPFVANRILSGLIIEQNNQPFPWIHQLLVAERKQINEYHGPLPSSLEKGFTYPRHNVVIFLDLVTSLNFLSVFHFPSISCFYFPLWLNRISLFIHTTFSLSISWWTTNWFCYPAIVNKASKNMHEQVPLSEGILTRVCIHGLYSRVK